MVVMPTCLELVKEIQYKLMIMGVTINGPSIIFGWNMSVVNGASILDSKLSKKHLVICYHAVREASAAVIFKVACVKGTYNIANCQTNILSCKTSEKEVEKFIWSN